LTGLASRAYGSRRPGRVRGRLARSRGGRASVGCDALIVLTDPRDPLLGKHAAEVTPEREHARSHGGQRGHASRAIVEQMIRGNR